MSKPEETKDTESPAGDRAEPAPPHSSERPPENGRSIGNASPDLPLSPPD